MGDQQLYDIGLRPRVLINWESFERRGIPPGWRAAFTGSVINAYTRWANVAGIDLRFQFYGYTNKTFASSGELLICMDDRHPTEPRLTSIFGSYNQLEVVFHRMSGADLTPWNYVPFNGRPGEYDMQAIMVHEFGHCLGLDHSTQAGTAMYQEYDYHAFRFGPFEADTARARHHYPDFTRNRLRQMRSTDGGVSWSAASNDLTSYNHIHARTNTTPAVAALPGSGMYVVGWTLVDGSPTWLRGDGNTFLMRDWQFFGTERALHGPALASDGQGSLMTARVQNDDAGSIKILASRDQGYRWQRVAAPAEAQTYGTPGLTFTRIDQRPVWILVWSHLDTHDDDCTGWVRSSFSSDYGRTWTPPRQFDANYKALAGVAIAADSESHVMVAFASAPHAIRGLNRLRSFKCNVVGDRLCVADQVGMEESTRLQPALTYDESTNRFIMAWRDQNFLTSLSTARMAADDRRWHDRVRLDASSNTAPALASMPSLGETVLWYASE